YAHLDSGALYRGVTLVALREAVRRGGEIRAGLLSEGPEAILRAAEDRGLVLHPDGPGFAAYLEGDPVDEVIRLPEVTRNVSEVSADPQVREWVNAHLRELVRVGRDVVVDGRDIGTIVFPQANLKVFLVASPEVRARRRVMQRGEGASEAEIKREAALLAARDAADSSRAVAPLRQAEHARLLDTSGLTFAQQVERIVGWAREALKAES
ncbi:MAG TPA: (d)CMP kinase, partial [Gemmatimonadales bacterium]|nr:(d)CMP kinase [Gemmatimonadales bacterium]